MVKFSRLDATAVHVRHTAKPHAKGRKPQPRPITAVVQAVMVVPMECLGHTQAACQFVKALFAKRMDGLPMDSQSQ
ncbi:MAG TPA: hypothetical protein PK043_07265, partial [Alicycliphilus sp.]|nr:hypothetical protein [Alicycliphilus sp.]